MNKRTVYIVVGVIAVAALAGGLVWRSLEQSRQAAEVLRSAFVEQGDMLVVVTASGRVRPAQRTDLSFATAGRVAEVLVDVGDQVEAGDILARLDTERLGFELARAEANLAAAESQLTKLKMEPQQEEIEAATANLRAAEAQVSAATAERDQLARLPGEPQIAAAEAEVASALTAQKKASDFHETTMQCWTFQVSEGESVTLPGGEVITAPEDIEQEICPLLGTPEEQARYRLEAADRALEAARARLEAVESGASETQLRAAQSNLAATAARSDAARAQLDLLLEGPTYANIKSAEGHVAQVRASVKQAELALENAVLKAPFAGTVAAIDLTVGAQVSSGLAAVTLVDVASFHVNAVVDEMDVGRLVEGQTARLTFDALPDIAVEGPVRRIAAAASLGAGVVAYDVRIDIPSIDAPIRADMTVNATILVEELSDVLKIPTWAVRVDRQTGQYYVHRRSPDGVERVDIRLGVRHDDSAQVLDGLAVGDQIVRIPESSRFNSEAD